MILTRFHFSSVFPRKKSWRRCFAENCFLFSPFSFFLFLQYIELNVVVLTFGGGESGYPLPFLFHTYLDTEWEQFKRPYQGGGKGGKVKSHTPQSTIADRRAAALCTACRCAAGKYGTVRSGAAGDVCGVAVLLGSPTSWWWLRPIQVFSSLDRAKHARTHKRTHERTHTRNASKHGTERKHGTHIPLLHPPPLMASGGTQGKEGKDCVSTAEQTKTKQKKI